MKYFVISGFLFIW